MFRNDYSEICAPEVLEKLKNCLGEQNIGYGLDVHSASAAEKILGAFGLSDSGAEVFFLAGGTQANAVTLSFLMRPYEAVICCGTGHINVHETGAVEGSGHKVLTSPGKDGKLLPEEIERIYRLHADEHMVKPKIVYISDSTETGTVYKKAELEAIKKTCEKLGLLLFIDGARLGVALTSPENDMTPADFAANCDVFYVGGTKNGAMYGEAIVVKDPSLSKEFRYHIKNRGAMLAKGFAVGIQFEALFTDGLYFRLAENSNATASFIREGLEKLGVETVGGAKTNQIFISVPAPLGLKLEKEFGLELWTDNGDTRVERIVTSFAAKIGDCETLINYIGNNL